MIAFFWAASGELGPPGNEQLSPFSALSDRFGEEVVYLPAEESGWLLHMAEGGAAAKQPEDILRLEKVIDRILHNRERKGTLEVVQLSPLPVGCQQSQHLPDDWR